MNKVVIGIIVAVIVIGVAIGAYYMFSSSGSKVLKVGTSPDFPPFEYVSNETGEIVGIDIDLIKAIAEKLGYKVELVPIQFDGLIPALQQGQIDVAISGMTITEEREKKVDFSIPYWEAQQAILVVKDSAFNPKSLEDLAGKVVGVQSGTTAEELLNSLKESGVDIEIKSYPSYTLAVQDLVNGRVDAVVVDSPVACTLASMYNLEVASLVPTGERYGIAVREGNRELLDKINQALQEILNSDEWDKIVSKYLKCPG